MKCVMCGEESVKELCPVCDAKFGSDEETEDYLFDDEYNEYFDDFQDF